MKEVSVVGSTGWVSSQSQRARPRIYQFYSMMKLREKEVREIDKRIGLNLRMRDRYMSKQKVKFTKRDAEKIVKGFTGIDAPKEEKGYKKLVKDLKPMAEKLNDLKILARVLKKKNLSEDEIKEKRKLCKKYNIPSF